ncbi:hypothetical protein I8752_07925 [Nostocaceae cyanobacterium CENA369]|uniref:Uncharacterized protein n=1 Tax=Dendronalium phyllosphericum CENA369 TaxID=1725256 RepID=A0A8J7I4Q5_9NOST|nr:hypothetical protein [Dendronalium phyllosphericum]MBH8572946.1 hypothetical protein [Dendronalium phyllosphericum CENA369]
MKSLDLGLTGKARIWQDEPLCFPGDYRPVFYPVEDERIETILDNAKVGSISKTEVMIEILVPLGARFLYGCLGAIFEPNDSGKLVLKVSIATESERQLNTSLASSLDIVRVGITEEYVPSVTDGARLKLQEPGVSDILGSGEISFNRGAFGEIGSSKAFFHDLGYAVIEVIVRDKGSSYNIKPPLKKVLEQF